MAHSFKGHHGNGSGHAKGYERYAAEGRREKNAKRKRETRERKLERNRMKRELKKEQERKVI